MPTLTITFTQEIQVSVQAHATDGDIILFCNPTTSGGFSSATQSDVVLLGTCLTIASNKYSNPSGLLGYYAEVCFRNDSRTEAELFGINADIFESSK